MKKILVFLSFIAFFFSCTKESVLPEPEKLVEVSFQMNLLGEGTPITKSVEKLFEYPDFLQITLKSTRTGLKYEIPDTRVPVRVPVDTYTVEFKNNVWSGHCYFWDYGNWYTKGLGISCDNKKYRGWAGTGDNTGFGPILTSGPSLDLITSELEISKDGKYVLETSLACCALIWNADSVEKVRGYFWTEWYNVECAHKYENLQVVFLKKWANDMEFKLELAPYSSENAETTTYRITKNSFEYGKYYELKCNEIDCTDSQASNILCNSWEKGTL